MKSITSSSSLESIQSTRKTKIEPETPSQRPHFSLKKILLVSLLLLSSLHIFVELVLLFADYLDENLPKDIVKKVNKNFFLNSSSF